MATLHTLPKTPDRCTTYWSTAVGIKDELDDSLFEHLCTTYIDTIQFTVHVRETVKPMYTCPWPISAAKYKDL